VSIKEQGMAQSNPGQIQEDDITAVIGRFHAWNTGQVPVELPQPPDGVSRLQPITYEEALAAHRGNRTQFPKPVKSVLALERKLNSKESSGKDQRSGTAPGLTGNSLSHADSDSRPMSALHVQAQTQDKKVSVATGKSVLPAKRLGNAGAEQIAKPVKRARTRSRGQLAKPVSVGIAKSKEVGARSVSALVQVAPASKPSIPKDRKKVMVSAGQVAPQTFQKVFEKRMAADLTEEGNDQKYVTRGKSSEISQAWTIETVGLASANPGRVNAQGKTIAMKLRMSPGEHAQIKAGADEAGVTLAAYMRQCTLDVRVLRELLMRTIQDLKSPTATVASRTLKEPLVALAASEPLSFMSALKKIWTRKRLVMTA